MKMLLVVLLFTTSIAHARIAPPRPVKPEPPVEAPYPIGYEIVKITPNK